MNQTPRTMSLADASQQLEKVVAGMAPNEEIELTVEGKIVARLVRLRTEPRRPRGFGSCRGMLTIIKEDDEHLADFKEYME